ncbi:MAG: hypothetical protein K0Q49_82 [Haloplasmataceae bacterium]|jgi:hypothetical protein|nr:hypothetical protein [Haloplasmataceae bacterium]
MTNSKKMLSFIIILFLVLAGVTVGLIYFAYNITKFTTYSANTKIANLNISGLFGDQAERELNNETVKWTSEASVNFVLQDYVINIDTEEFEFNVDKSIEKVKNGTSNTLLVEYLNSDLVIETLMNDELFKEKAIVNLQFDTDKIKRDLIYQVALLKYNINIDLGRYQSNQVDVYSINVNNIENNAAAYIAQIIKEIAIKPKKFSLLESLKPYIESTENSLDNSDYSIVASGLYQLILNSNFNSINKHIGEDLPSYLKVSSTKDLYGYETLIDVEKNKDLTFYNPNSYIYTVKISYSEALPNRLTFTLVGLPFLDEITTSISESVDFTSKESVIRYVDICPNGNPSSGNNVCPGSHMGNRTFVTRTILDFNGISKTFIINEDVYMPSYVITIKNPSEEE